jgi:hypothetical protein
MSTSDWPQSGCFGKGKASANDPKGAADRSSFLDFSIPREFKAARQSESVTFSEPPPGPRWAGGQRPTALCALGREGVFSVVLFAHAKAPMLGDRHSRTSSAMAKRPPACFVREGASHRRRATGQRHCSIICRKGLAASSIGLPGAARCPKPTSMRQCARCVARCWRPTSPLRWSAASPRRCESRRSAPP